MKLPAKHLINTRLLKTVTNFALKVELGVVSLEAALNTETSCAVRTPRYCRHPLASFIAHHAPF
jgi:hypothetical protein